MASPTCFKDLQQDPLFIKALRAKQAPALASFLMKILPAADKTTAKIIAGVPHLGYFETAVVETCLCLRPTQDKQQCLILLQQALQPFLLHNGTLSLDPIQARGFSQDLSSFLQQFTS